MSGKQVGSGKSPIDIPAAIRRGEYTFHGCSELVEAYGNRISKLDRLIIRAYTEGWTSDRLRIEYSLLGD